MKKCWIYVVFVSRHSTKQKENFLKNIFGFEYTFSQTEWERSLRAKKKSIIKKKTKIIQIINLT